ncbi:MAG: TPM domain-containing protein [Gemmatimonadaceae bacterium]
MLNRVLFLLVALPLMQTTPTGGAITKYVPPVPTPASFISDQKSVLTADARTTLDARITAIQKAGLGDIAVAILPSIGDYSPNQVAVEIYRTWRVGSSAALGSVHRDVGVLMLIVPKELAPNHRGECWINTGLGAEGIITDATAGAICRDSIIPYLRNKEYAGAVNAGIGGIEARLQADAGLASAVVAPQPVVDSRRHFPWEIALPVGGIVGALAAAFGVVRRRRYRPRVCPRCGRTMRRLDERSDDARLDAGQVVEENVGSVDYDVWVCECGETTVVPYTKWFSSYSVCRECHRKTAKSETVTIMPATTMSSGLAEKRFSCKACAATWSEQIVLPVIVPASSSSDGGGGDSGGGGGGGGSSFGGSGATSGGGGGSSY